MRLCVFHLQIPALACAVACVCLAFTAGAAPAVLEAAAGASPGQVQLSWESEPGRYFQLEAATSLTLEFSPRSGVLHTNGTPCVVLEPATDAPARFYRLREVDPDAGAYVLRAGVRDWQAVAPLSEFVAGLKALGLFDHAVFLASLRSTQNAGGGTRLFAVRGPDGTLVGAPSWGTNGLEFDGQALRYVTLANPLRSAALPAVSLWCAFVSDQTANRTVFGGCDHPDGFGPALFAGGSPQQGVWPTEIYFDYTHDGSTAPANFDTIGKRTFNYGNTGFWQVSLATFCVTNVSLQSNIDRRYETGGEFDPVWNDVANWRIGARLDGAARFAGTISLVAAFDVALSQEQYDAVRRLYRATLGSGLPFPEASFVVEGDSMCDEAQGYEFAMALTHRAGWEGKIQKHNVAQSAENLDEMLAEYPTQVHPWAAEPGRKYLFLWGGSHNLARPPEEIYGQLTEYWRLARADGFKVGAFTITSSVGDSPGWAANRVALNALIRAGGTNYDYLIDVAAEPAFANPADTNYFISDGAHLNANGFERIADLIQATLPKP